jgi:hypothetical protein
MVLTPFGLFAVGGMLLCYALDNRTPWFGLGFAAFCALGSGYGFLEGAWPFGLLEAIWSLVAVNRWWQRGHAPRKRAATAAVAFNRRSRPSLR